MNAEVMTAFRECPSCRLQRILLPTTGGRACIDCIERDQQQLLATLCNNDITGEPMTDELEELRVPLLRASKWFGLSPTDKDDTVREIQLTARQATDFRQGHAFMFTQPKVPDIAVDNDGTIIERGDARPKPKDT